ncbi:Peptidyl-prolyl cis-trans isomerase cyp18 [Fundidesulfovibrio magnetotacticus]|uniref:Peptidyl-prolyl cis-trans isomerase n=1 Tax=Fundidesulfovibrio magnetotacticus TaxID=2730080 RepID=A0A6V8LQV8_9BACT|nr:peptidylprolyl isomerase [Fundidesulfovibrio magnetotacticus]GFK94873.1 Peptidyl-prolyl cis-trans isomerase cyp18 [Fundidesulfovibrio magnetotacticus]
MQRKSFPVLTILLAALLALSWAGPAAAQNRDYVALTTSKGAIVLELYPDKAPQTVANFLSYVKEGFYDGLVFHRVINGFMIQGGGMDKNLQPKQGRPPIKNEADNGLKNEAYTIAMARTPVPDSATSQFFINVKDNRQLDHSGKTPNGWGYAVFGKVVEGREVVDAIKAVPTGMRAGLADVPVESVVILKAETVKR